MSKPFIITFAGPPGSSKTPIAMHLSYTFNLPIIQMDAIRMEVREDVLVEDINEPRALKEFTKRAWERYQPLLQKGVCFIDDSSADRSWKQRPTDQYYQLKQYDYDFFIISIDLSREYLQKLYDIKDAPQGEQADRYHNDHVQFLELYSDDVGVHITDHNFLDRIKVAEEAVKGFLAGRQQSAAHLSPLFKVPSI
jgi:hypothetical protein